jgi:hypothetical protein
MPKKEESTDNTPATTPINELEQTPLADLPDLLYLNTLYETYYATELISREQFLRARSQRLKLGFTVYIAHRAAHIAFRHLYQRAVAEEILTRYRKNRH